MKRVLYFLIIPGHLKAVVASGILALFVLSTSAQDCIRGRVLDASNGQILPGASVNVINYGLVSTDANGNFKVCSLHSDTLTMLISFVGYQSKEEHVNLRQKASDYSFSLEPKSVLINDLVVTATRTDNRVLNTPVRVNLITPKLIESTALQNVDDVLKLAPGINYSRPFGIFSSKAIVTMRGLSGKEQGRVLVLLDGVPINKSDGGTVDWNMVDIGSVQKIEITKGPGSAIYGQNAMGGIINIITRAPSEAIKIRASVEAGSFWTFGEKINAGGTKKLGNSGNSFFWVANLFNKSSKGYITQSPADRAANPYIIKSSMKEEGVNVKAGLNFKSGNTLSAMVNYYNDHRGTGEKEFQPDGNVTDHDSYGMTLNYKGNSGKTKVNSSLYNFTENYKKVNEYIKDDYTWYNVLSVRRDIGWNTAMTRTYGRQEFTGGFDFRNGSVDAYDKYYTSTDIVYNKGKMNTYALFLQDEIGLSEKFRLIAGLRYDMADFYDGAFYITNPTMETAFMKDYQVPDMPVQHWQALSPRISLQYKWNETDRIYLLYSKGFRPSVLDDLCRSGRIKGGFKIANPALKPEYIDNYEAGIDLQAIEKLNFSTSLFYSPGKDFQYYVSNGQTIDMGFGDRPIFIRANISKVEIYGIETEFRYEASSDLSFYANYSYTHSLIRDYKKIASNDTINLSGKYLTDVPAHIFTAGGNWNNKLVNAGLAVHYNGPMYINDQNIKDDILQSVQYEGYTTVDLKLWRVFKDHYRLSLNVMNLLDKKYYDSKDAVCPGRFITGSFEVNF
ncbi:MAG: TonB-dependent receptor [Bacteroidetes bacterium]|nr:TonB-dependent receptor [Bacteroidota bacterium]